MNPRQRRAILLLGLAFLGLIGVFALVAGYVSDVRAEVDPKVRVLALSRDLQPYAAIDDSMVEEVEMPEHWVPRTAIRDRGSLVGLVPVTALKEGSILQQGMLAPPPELASGQREVAILVDAETGVAGKLGRGSTVDIIATYPASEDGQVRARSRIVVPGARVIEVGRPELKGGGGVSEESADPEQVVPVTFALSVKDQLKVTYAESNATEVRLGLQRPDEADKVPPKRDRVYAPEEP
ncbi:MAG TPA: Flp pilus assembly protein CpaB [Solirubrobacteraceae bacterium]